jgi:phosphatidylserine/phosphatidylglycerophosphate/cardiolipin synthase-like enzyme
MAKEQENPSAMVASAMGIAKVFHPAPIEDAGPLSFKSAQSMHDIGRKLLMTVGCENPRVAAIELAIEANDSFVSRLEQIAAAEKELA